jgi:preprotein translocase subunit Sss1
VNTKALRGSRVPLVVLTEGRKPTWEEWEAAHRKLD